MVNNIHQLNCQICLDELNNQYPNGIFCATAMPTEESMIIRSDLKTPEVISNPTLTQIASTIFIVAVLLYLFVIRNNKISFIPIMSRTFCVAFLLSVANCQFTWTYISERLSSPVLACQIYGYHETRNMAWFFGGRVKQEEYSNIFSWNLTSKAFQSHGQLSIGLTSSWAESYTTIGDIIYFVLNSKILSFDMKSVQIIDENITTPQATNTKTCLASYNDKYLIALGVGTKTQIYDLQLKSWMTNPDPPSMIQSRTYSGCQVVGHYVYVFGGYNRDSIEKLHLITLQNWNLLSNRLSPSSVQYPRSIALNNNIYVIGGMLSTGASLNNVNIISTLDDSVTKGSNLKFEASRMSVIPGPNRIIYVLGGRIVGGNNNRIQVSSILPTHEPSASPTATPTDITTIPTVIPTLEPTIPTLEPTVSPTACLDANINIKSNDGSDFIQNMTFEISGFMPLDINITSTNMSITNYEGRRYREHIKCNGNDGNVCNIECITNASCPLLSVDVTDTDLYQLAIECNGKQSCDELSINLFNAEIDIINIKCYGLRSCFSMTMLIEAIRSDFVFIHCIGIDSCKSMEIILVKPSSDNHYISHLSLICQTKNACSNGIYISNHTNIKNTTIICSDPYSCNSTVINTNNVYNGQLLVYCISPFSCYTMNIEFKMETDLKGDYITNIICFEDNSCNDMLLMAEDDDVFIGIFMYKYSSDIRIIHKQMDKLYFHCGNPSDKRFIRYDTDEIKTQQQIIELGRAKYDNHNLPCEGIEVQCSTDQYFPISCNMEYELNAFNLSKYLSARNKDVTCYWMELSTILTPICRGTCGTNISLYIYNQSWNLNIYIDTENHSETELFAKCNYRFGTENDTLLTLSDIDGIFYHVLRILGIFSPYQIYAVLDGPETILRDGIYSINCNEITSFETIKLTTNTSIQSGIESEDEFNTLFDNDGPFIRESEKLISIYLNIAIVLERVETEYTSYKGLKTWQWILIIVGTVLMVILILYWLYKYYRKTHWMEMSNPLIISVAIGIYDDPVTDPEVDGYLKDLNGIHWDATNIGTLFKQMKYQIFPEISKYIKEEWTKEDLITFLKEKAKHLRDNIDDYDGLITMVSSHGMDGCVITSDYKKIPKQYIHRLFSIDEQNVCLRGIPRIFLFDCCEGEYERDYHFRGDNSDDEEEEEKGDEDKDVYYDRGKELKREVNNPWTMDELHPDHMLGIINSATAGFQSKMRSNKGSYMIEALVRKLLRNEEIREWCSCQSKLVLGDIMQEIQEELEKMGKQLLDFRFNNGVQQIIFMKNTTKGIIDDNNGEREIDKNDDDKKQDVGDDKNDNIEREMELMMMMDKKRNVENIGDIENNSDENIERMYDKGQKTKGDDKSMHINTVTMNEEEEDLDEDDGGNGTSRTNR